MAFGTLGEATRVLDITFYKIGNTTYSPNADGSVDVIDGPSVGVTYAAGSASANNVLDKIRRGQAQVVTGSSNSSSSGRSASAFIYPSNSPGYYKIKGVLYYLWDNGDVWIMSGPFSALRKNYKVLTAAPGAEIQAQIFMGNAERITQAEYPAIPAQAQRIANIEWDNAGGSRSSFLPGIAGDFWTNASQAVQTFMPLIQTGIQEISQGRRNSAAIMAGQIARKQQQLAATRDPVKRAQLTAEIASLQQQQQAFSTLLNQGVPNAPVDVSSSSSSVSSWVPWAVLGVGGVLALAAVTASSGKK